nr:hypothetical protein [Tanacetum cinerariifolium]
MLFYNESTSSTIPSEKLQENIMDGSGCALNLLLKMLIRGKDEKVNALGANDVMSGSRVRIVWIEVGGGIVRAMVVSRVVVKVVLIGWEVFERWFWMGELSLEDMSMKSVLGIFFRGFWVEELALDAMEYDDQGMKYEEGCLHVL